MLSVSANLVISESIALGEEFKREILSELDDLDKPIQP